MESAKRVTPDMSRVRPVLLACPMLHRRPLIDSIREASPLQPPRGFSKRCCRMPSLRALVSTYHGISPVMANEIVFQATGSSETRAGDVNAESAN